MPKYAILAEHCADVGRCDFAEIERTNLQPVSLSRPQHGARRRSRRIVDPFGRLAEAGVQHVIISTADTTRLRSSFSGATCCPSR